MTNLQRMLVYYRRYRIKLYIGGFSVLLSAATGLLSPMVVRRAIDDLLKQITREKLFIYGLLVLCIAAVKGVFLFTQRLVIVGMSRDIENDLRNDYYGHLQRLPLG